MVDVTEVKDAGSGSAVQIIDRRSRFEYPVEALGASSGFGPGENELAIHLSGSPNIAAAEAILNAIELPTCSASLLDITVNVGTYLVNDVTSVTANANNTTYYRVVVAIDDATGVLEVFALQKTEIAELYPDLPAGKTWCCDLKDYSVPPGGTALTEDENFIA